MQIPEQHNKCHPMNVLPIFDFAHKLVQALATSTQQDLLYRLHSTQSGKLQQVKCIIVQIKIYSIYQTKFPLF